MKRFLILVLCLSLLLCGCGRKDAPEETPTTEGLLIVDPTQAPTTQATEPPTTQATVPPTTAPTAPPTTETTVPPTTAPPAVVITKHPTSESVSPGGGTWFIAHADNATQITWEFFSPDGTIYSLDEAARQNPGLILEVLPEDTLALRNIPASFDGWSARARFDGPGGTATTDRAKITVKEPYSTVMETYRKAFREKGSFAAYGVSEMVEYGEHVGYALMDLDGNGVNELIIAGMGEHSYALVVYEIYTLQGGSPVSVLMSGVRNRYYMMSDGRLYCEGSGGAADAYYSVYRVSGATLTLVEQIHASDDPNIYSDAWPCYYYSSWTVQEEPMDPVEAEDLISLWLDSMWLPAMTRID